MLKITKLLYEQNTIIFKITKLLYEQNADDAQNHGKKYE